MNRKQETIGHVLALITIFIWGTTFISTKVLLEVISPIEILFLRFTLGYAALLVAYPKRLKTTDRKQEIYFCAAGLCGVTLYYLLENIALTHTFASNVGVIISISPFFTALFAHLFLQGEKISLQFLFGFGLAVFGIILMSQNGSSSLQLNPFGDILAMLAAVVWAMYSILTRKIGSFQYNTIQATRRIFFYGLVFMSPALFAFGFNPDISRMIQPINLFNILFLGLGASALCFVTWNSAVNRLGAVKTSIYIYIVPVITVVTSVIVLKETITMIGLFGMILTLAGLFISEFRMAAKR